MDLGQAGRSEPWRRNCFHEAATPAGRSGRSRQALLRYRARSGPRRPRGPGPPSSRCTPYRGKTRAAFRCYEPPPALVGKLINTFKETDGNLKEVARSLIVAEESWYLQRQKLKAPAEWIAGVIRLTGAQSNIPIGRIITAQVALARRFGGRRHRTAILIPRQLGSTACLGVSKLPPNSPPELLESGLGPLASPETRLTVARAESRPQALALLVMAPEFLRR